MAFEHYKAATESTLYDGQGSYKSILFRICSLVRKEGQQDAGWCTASEKYLAQTTGYSERQVQRAVAQFKKDEVFAIRTFRKGGKEFNHYRPNMALLASRKRNSNDRVLISGTTFDDTVAHDDEGTRQAGGWPHDSVSQPNRQDGGGVGKTREVEERGVNAITAICRTELRSDLKGFDSAISSKALSGKDYGGRAPEPPLISADGDDKDSSLPGGSESRSSSSSRLEDAANAARSKQEMLAALAKRAPVPAPPSAECLAPPLKAAAPRPATPYQVAKALVEETKKTAWDTYLRAYSLAHQFAGYLEERASKGEKAYALDHWPVLYTADFIDAFKAGWKFKDLEDAIDVAQTTKFRFACCTPLRLLERGESLMKAVHALRRKGMTIRQKLGERYRSWYLENAGSIEMQEQESAVKAIAAEKDRQLDEERKRDADLDADVPILTLKTIGKVKCINPECSYRFDTREIMHRHFDDCFSRAVEQEPIDEEDARREEMEDVYDDFFGIAPVSYYHWLEEDEKAGRWDQYAARNADGGMMFNPWAEEEEEEEETSVE